ncbi:hypothetical protein BCV69DRAFT_282322 [Microstroma glucosiphilum]|uniref:MIP18 family-like domain-containing protein n=1 Tax=Pseudomicrostroma glucosiphilum TaxID=1684307 RepID=A0A316UB30_9BASI|nr:hypothetical protein BCV69DRAFT_282322 [Pseudomicrostroma glucosiphilum]PWN21603.1 hypothetical protein BCV69DRAFT_282322 [Pseudomicrostroma glucosiphilum]
MSTKDNANPIVHRPAGHATAKSTTASTSTEDWWRDEAIHLPDTSYSKKQGIAALDEGDDDGMDEDDVKEKREEIDAEEVFDLIRSINDPEHPLTLEELAVVNASHITVTHPDDYPGAPRYPAVRMEFTPTIPHCSMATLIGLSLRVRLLHALPPSYKVDISIRPGTHQSENSINKQLNDKERVAAALENEHLLGVVRGCLETAQRRGRSEEEWTKKAEEVARQIGVSA